MKISAKISKKILEYRYRFQKISVSL